MVSTFKLLECPKCPKKHYGRGDRRPNTFGKYKVYITSANWLIFKCVRCNEVFKHRIMGGRLTKADMTKEEVENVE